MTKIRILKKDYSERIFEYYYQKVWEQNKEYLKEHGRGPYAYNGMFETRTSPYLDAGFYLEIAEFIKTEFNAVSSPDGFYIFESEEDALLFKLTWS